MILWDDFKLDRGGAASARKQAGVVAKGFELDALPDGSAKERGLLTRLPSKRTLGAMMNSAPASVRRCAKARQSGMGSTKPKWRTGTASPSTALLPAVKQSSEV